MMTQRWQLILELTYDIDPEDTKERYPGDAEVDYARRSLERVRPALEKIVGGNPFAHYHIEQMPRRCYD